MLVNFKKNTALHSLYYFLGAVVLALGFVPAFVLAESEGLAVTDVEVVDIDSVKQTATVKWNTNIFSQGVVVCGNYSEAPFTFDIAKPHFGYTWSTVLITSLVNEHKVPLAALTPGEHYCRVASRVRENSPWVVSNEITFIINGEKEMPQISAPSSTTETTTSQEGSSTEQEAVTDKQNEGASTGNVCYAEWWVWVFVLVVLLIAVTWPKELAAKLSSQSSIKRLYVIAASGLVIFVIALIRESGHWILPIGLGTIAIIVATIVDILRTHEGDDASVRLSRISTTLIVTLLVSLLLAIVLAWTCTILPLIVIIAILTVRYVLNGKQQEEQKKTDK